MDYAILKTLIDRGMYINVPSVFSVMVFSACCLFLFGLLIRQRHLSGIRYNFLLLCMLLLGVRMLTPVEIFDFSYEIFVPYVLPDITAFLEKTLFSLGEVEVSRIRFLGWIWMAGAAFMLVRTMFRYWKLRRLVTAMEPVRDDMVIKILEQTNRVYGRGRKFVTVTSDSVSSPMVMGLCRPYIILPEASMAEEELYYTFCHELAHYYGGDLHIKFFWEIGKNLLWWNPLMYLFEKELCALLELRADDRVVKALKEDERWEYADCLVQMAKKRRERCDRRAFVLAYGGTDSFTLKQRIEILCSRISGERQRKILSDAVVVVCFILVLTLPNVLFVPDSMPEPEEGEIFTGTERFDLRDSGVFMIENLDGTYDFYYAFEYCCTMEEVFDLRVKVYQNMEEALENEQME